MEITRKNETPAKQEKGRNKWLSNVIQLLFFGALTFTACAPKQQVSSSTAPNSNTEKLGNTGAVAQDEGIKSSVTPAVIALYAGNYRLTAGERTLDVRVFGEGGALMTQATGQPVTQMLADGDHAFKLEKNPNIRLVFTMENGRAEGIQLHQGGRIFHGKRIQ